jgi:crotonobetainyl-CoA:carnitine CoA-transferase CaiB-like acyl-CoA transferase
MGGLMSVSGHPQEPMKVGISMVDILTSFYAAVGILAALRHRDQSGEGQYIDLSLLDCGLASLSHFAMNYLVSGEVPVRRGNGGFGGIPSQAFQCSDKPLLIVAGNNKQFGAFCKLAGRMDIFEDPRFSSTAGRIANREQLLPILEVLFRTRTRDEWLALLDAHDIPGSPVNELPDVFANPQIQQRGMLTQTEHPLAGALQILANPLNFSATPIGSYRAPPLMGESTDAILRERLGLDDDALATLKEKGAI